MPNLTLNRPTWAEVDLDSLAFNFHSIKAFVGEAVQQMAVVKADAYGHGAVKCAERLEAEGADWFSVATLEEAIELRQAGIRIPILVLGSFFAGQERELLNFELSPLMIYEDQAESLNKAAAERGTIARCHLKIDTGMNRVGIRREHWESAATRMSELRNIEIEGLMTHFAVADEPEENSFTEHQMAEFSRAVEIFHNAGHRPKYIDLANSPGAIMHPLSRSKMVRIGGLLFGLADDVIPEGVKKPELKRVMTLHSRIALLKTVPSGESIGYGRTFVTTRDSLIATLPIGYNDGYRRGLSNKAHVLVNGKAAPVVGRISMDWTTIDVTDCGETNIGDQVTLIGDDGESAVMAKDLAEWCDTFSYEITCGIGKRVPRVFVCDHNSPILKR